MSIEGSLALVGLMLLALGVGVSVRRTTSSSLSGDLVGSAGSEAAAVDGSPGSAKSSPNAVVIALLTAGVVALLAAGTVLVAMWVLFRGLF